MNICIYGGTFNPPHVGHLIVAERVREEFRLGKVLFIPSAISPHKQHLELIDPVWRMKMLQLALDGETFFEAVDLEISRGGVSYTVDTLQQLKDSHPHDSLFLIIGMDNLAEFNTWKSPEKILELARVILMTRPGVEPSSANGFQQKFTLCRVPEIGVSSSEIRERVKQGKSIRYLVPKAVEAYIYDQELYR